LTAFERSCSVALLGESVTEPIETLRKAGYRDSFRVLHPAATDVETSTGFRPDPRSAKIDYVFVRGAATILDATIDRTRVRGRWPSDHCPVTAEILWL
jgi:endonuclease/exonuclease/phosphatase family metal-dependent hydrolase